MNEYEKDGMTVVQDTLFTRDMKHQCLGPGAALTDNPAANDGIGSESKNPQASGLPLKRRPVRKFKLGCLRSGSVKTERTAAAVPQALRYANHRFPPRPKSTPPAAPSQTLLSDLVPSIALPERPRNVLLKPERAIACDYSDLSSKDVSNVCCGGSARTPQPPVESRIMGLTKTQRISILLAIDGAFFFVELAVGEIKSGR